MSLRRLSYRSLRSPDLNDEQLLRELILPARARNHRMGITTCLWCGQYSFVQVMEGPDSAIHALMSRIVDDPRHSGIKVLSDRPVKQRLFNARSLKWVRSADCDDVGALALEALENSCVTAEVGPPSDANSKGAKQKPIQSLLDPQFREHESGSVVQILANLICAEPTLY